MSKDAGTSLKQPQIWPESQYTTVEYVEDVE